MKDIICIANQKGGVGKTTTAVNLAAAMALVKKRTLLIDCDPQGNATTGIGINKKGLEKNLYHLLIGESEPEDVLVETELKHLKVLPARTDLAASEVELVDRQDRERILKGILNGLSDQFDYMVIDCPPSLGILTVNAMCAATSLVIPLQCEFYALEGLGQLIRSIRRIKKNLNPQLAVSGILLTMFDQRTNLSFQVAQEAEEHFKHLVFKSRIPRNVRLGEAPSFGKPILLYAPHSTGAKSYIKLAREIMRQRPKKTQV